ncbi:MAG: hypothetical protein ACLR23_29150 [Clostridia bacterium]
MGRYGDDSAALASRWHGRSDTAVALLVAIRTCGVAGRRELASRLSLSERVLRQDIVILQTYGLIAVTAGGISVTPDGIQTIRSLEEAWPRTAEMWRAVEET